ncbi:MAG TPA: BON domain-containing protein [Methylomirabilota bacterium]|nr:BON domain-containing protein [Methylomirabilota bacterium]
MTHRLTILAAVLGIVVLTGCQTTTGRTAGTVIDDGATTAAVKSKLVADRPANLTAVGVDTVNGVTYLTGVVDTPEQRMRAEQIAWETSGVRQIVNNIQVRRPIAAAPSAAVATSPMTVRRGAVVATVTSVDTARSQVTVNTGTEQLLLQLPAGVVRDLRPGDRVSLDVNVQPAR